MIPAGPSSSAGAKTGLLPAIGTSRPWEAATPAIEAVWPGATVIAIAFTPSDLSLVTGAVMSVSVDWICCSTTVMPCCSAKYFDPARPPSPYSPSK